MVIGHGNVSLDVARALLQDAARLRATDIADYALAALAQSRVKRVRVVGRRAPMQAAFTTKEVRELMKLPGVGFQPVSEDLIPDLNSIKHLRSRRRLMNVLAAGSGRGWEEQPKRWSLDFCLSPSEFRPDGRDGGAVGESIFRRTFLTGMHEPEARVSAQGESVTFESPLVFRSIGYELEPLPEFEPLGILFDQRKGVIGNDGGPGRVAAAGEVSERKHFPGLYCAGWAKRGPTGVIATTMEDAFDTAESITRDWQEGEKFLGAAAGFSVEGKGEQSAGWEGVKSDGGGELAKCAVDWKGWLAIDKAEREKGREEGKERRKFTAVEDMLGLAASRKS